MQMQEKMSIDGVYVAECRDKDGNLKWTDVIENIVTTLGKNLLLDSTLAGSAYTTTGPFMGLLSSVNWGGSGGVITTLSSMTSYTSGTGAISLVTAGAHNLSPGDVFTISGTTGTGANVTAINGTWTATAGTTGTTLNFTIATGQTITTVTGGSLTYTTKTSDTQASHPGWTEANATNAPAYTTGGSAVRATCAWSAAANNGTGGGSKALSSGLVFTFTNGGTVEGALIVTGAGATSGPTSTAGVLYSAGAFSGGARAVLAGDTLTVSYSTTIS